MVTRGYSSANFLKSQFSTVHRFFFFVPGVIKSVLGIFPSFLWVISLVTSCNEVMYSMVNADKECSTSRNDSECSTLFQVM